MVNKSVDARKIEARGLALEIIYNIMEKGAYANLYLEKNLKQSSLSQNDKHLITEIVNGAVRMIKHLDWVLNLFLKSPVEKQNPWLRNILRMSLYQILFMDKIPDYASVNSAVELAIKKTGRKLSSVCNGVLRNIIRNKDNIKYPAREKLIKYLSVFYSHPEWLVEQWLHIFGPEETEKILIYNNRRPDLTIRQNKLKGSRDTLITLLQEENISAVSDTKMPGSVKILSMDKAPGEIKCFQKGYFYLQDVAAMLAAPILNPDSGTLVYDLCCGVGGKSTHLAEYMDNCGEIVAFDLYEKKIRLLNHNCRRLGITIVKGYQKDVLNIEPELKKSPRVFLDAPCSGLGVLNKRADLRWKKDPADISELTELQYQLLQKAANLVEPDGILVYSTCTINPQENEQVIEKFLKSNPNFKLNSFLDDISFFPLTPQDKTSAAAGMLTIIPGKYQSDGMFYARMRCN